MKNTFQERIEAYQYIPMKERLQDRSKYTVELRKSQRESLMKAKRALYSKDSTANFPLTHLSYQSPELSSPLPSVKFKAYLDLLQKEMPQPSLEEVIEYLRVLMASPNSPFSEFIDSGLLDWLITRNTLSETALADACWIFSNLVSDDIENTNKFIEKGGLAKLLSALEVLTLPNLECPLWALANIAGDCQTYRILLIESQLPEKLVDIFKGWDYKDLNVVRTLAWVCNNLAAGSEDFSMEQCTLLLQLLEKPLELTDENTFHEAIWALVNLSNNEAFVEAVISASGMSYAIKAILSTHLHTIEAGVHLIGNFCVYDTQYTQFAMNSNCLDYLYTVIDHPNTPIRRKVLWSLSNITAETVAQIYLLMTHKIWPKAIKSVLDEEAQVKIEAAYVLHNLILRTQNFPEVASELVSELGVIAEALKTPFFVDFTEIMLKVCAGILAASEACAENSQALSKFESSGCKDAVEKLVGQSNFQVAELASELLAKYYG